MNQTNQSKELLGWSKAQHLTQLALKNFGKKQNDSIQNQNILTLLIVKSLQGELKISLQECTQPLELTIKDLKNWTINNQIVYQAQTNNQKIDFQYWQYNEKPLIVLEFDFLYLFRNWLSEKNIIQRIQSIQNYHQKLSKTIDINNNNTLEKTAIQQLNQQGICIITGEAGSGKSTFAIKIIHSIAQQQTNIAICAFTGKAVSRLSQILTTNTFTSKQLKKIQPQTIHSLLKKTQTTKSTYHSQNLLPYSLILIDEISMVDINLFKELLTATPDNCKLIIIGDQQQLPPIGIGGIFDILKTHFKKNIQTLKSQHRFNKNSQIYQLAKLAKNNQLLQTNLPPPHKLNANNQERQTIFTQWLEKYITPIYQQKKYQDLLDNVILSPWRYKGVNHLNQIIQNYLFQKNLLQNHDQLCIGLPIVLRENKANINLFNGDRGVITENANNQLTINIKSKSYLLQELPKFEIAYAMTVHQTQGSEFNNVLVWLDETDPQTKNWLTNELLYTSITRAKKQIQICGNI